MIAPVHRLKKQEIVWLQTHKCKHSHTYLEHYACYLSEHPERQRVGYFDIESTNLDADFGTCLCYCIKEKGSDKIYGRTITKEEVTKERDPDKYVISECIEDLLKFDLIYGYYSTKFDFPFIRTRAVSMNLDFPYFGAIQHKDVYYIIKNKFKLHRSRLEVACNELLGKSLKTHFDGNVWRRAGQGNPEALKYIFEHCKGDVIDLERLTDKVLDYAYPVTKSI